MSSFHLVYDNLSRLLTSVDSSGGPTVRLSQTWDSNSNRAALEAEIDSGGGYAADFLSEYTFDNLARTISGYVTGDGNLLASDGTFDYEYDDENNRIRKEHISTGDYVLYTWDHRNRLTAIEFRDDADDLQKRVEYDYDVFDRRIFKRVDDDGDGNIDRAYRYVYDQAGKFDTATGVALDDIVLVFTDPDGEGEDDFQLSNRLMHGPAVDQVLADEQLVAEVFDDIYWALPDNQGTIRDLVDYNPGNDTTTSAKHLAFASFGEITSDSSPSLDFLYSYTGREWDPDAELYFYRARWYDSATGRFASEDWISFGAGDTNLSRYAANAPSVFADPSGLVVPGFHHFYPLYLGGSDNQLLFERSGIDHSAAHDYLESLGLGPEGGKPDKYDAARARWRDKFTPEQRRAIIKESMRRAGIPEHLIEQTIDQIMNNDVPGKNLSPGKNNPGVPPRRKPNAGDFSAERIAAEVAATKPNPKLALPPPPAATPDAKVGTTVDSPSVKGGTAHGGTSPRKGGSTRGSTGDGPGGGRAVGGLLDVYDAAKSLPPMVNGEKVEAYELPGFRPGNGFVYGYDDDGYYQQDLETRHRQEITDTLFELQREEYFRRYGRWRRVWYMPWEFEFIPGTEQKTPPIISEDDPA